MKLYNTLTRSQESFSPQDNKTVKLYTCGPTVYSYLQIGNWMAYLRWDTLVRMLKASELDVDWVMNITDVGHLVSDADDGEDKMEKGARREGKTAWEVAQMYTDDFLEGLAKLHIAMPDHLVKATDHIPEQIALIQMLEEKGFTYTIDDGVYFDTAKFPHYGELAKLKLDDLQAGARVEYNQQKRNVSDFALWKFSPANERRDMEWESPWGKGFPGWHIECSAMAMKYLGETLDIHCGGIDHIPVHHTNEIAQSEAATGKQFSRFWLHGNFLTVDGTKLSKSLGNSYTLQDLAEKGYSALDFRMFALQSHYRTEANFTWDVLEAAQNRRKSLQAIADLRFQATDSSDQPLEITPKLNTIRQAILVAAQDDLDTPNALAALSGLDDMFKHGLKKQDLAAFTAFVAFLDDIFGLGLLETTDITVEQKKLLVGRSKARQEKDWAESDKLRDQLATEGIMVRDSKDGQIWTRN